MRTADSIGNKIGRKFQGQGQNDARGPFKCYFQYYLI